MKDSIIKVLFIALLAISSVTQAQSAPWWWPGKTAVKTVQVSLPANNGGMISVTIPTKSTSVKRSIGHRRPEDSTRNRLDDERIAADLERHF